MDFKLILILFLFFGCSASEMNSCYKGAQEDYKECIQPAYNSLINQYLEGGKNMDMVIPTSIDRIQKCKKDRETMNSICPSALIKGL